MTSPIDISTAVVVLRKYSDTEITFKRDKSFVQVIVKGEPLGWLLYPDFVALAKNKVVSLEEIGE